MKAELEAQDIESIANRVAELLKPMLSNNGRHEGEDELMTIDETVIFLKLKEKGKGQIYQWVNNSKHGLGNFPYLKAGRRLRFSKKALLKWLERR